MPNVKPRPEKDCPTCGKHFACVKPTQVFCSKKCIRTGRNHNVCPCGVNTGSYQKKYCCPEHREKWQKHKAPTKMVTRVCLACGNELSRPSRYPGKMNYCSNACSHRQQKKVRDKFILNLNEHAVVFHSGWEIRFWAVCLRFDIPIRSYDGPDITTSEGVYRPDFIVNDQVVDVKGWLRPESAAKIGEAREQVDVMLIDESALCALESGDLSALNR